MLHTVIRKFSQFDGILLGITLSLSIFGLVMILSLDTSEERFFPLFLKQVAAFLIGCLLLGIVSLVDYRIWRSYANILFIFGLLLLGGVLVFGVTIRGTRGWYSLFGQSFQPIEFVKLLFVIFLAKTLADLASRGYRLNDYLKSGIFMIFPFILVILQPDFGSAMIFLLVWLGMVFLAGMKPVHLGVILLLIMVAAAAAWSLFLEDYQKERILTFLEPSRDALGQGYNITQSIVAIGSGEFLGRGWGLGTQSQLNFLPAKETDFIFAVIAEELGFVGVFVLFLLFGAMFVRMKQIMDRATDNFGVFVVWGVLLLIAIEFFVNIAMNVGFAPVVGLPLPFVSVGGSSLMISLLAVGILESIWIRRRTF